MEHPNPNNDESPTAKSSLLSRKPVEFALHFFIVILGVLAAFWLSSWGEQLRDRELEHFYIEELRESLDQDHWQLSDVIREQSHRRNTLDSLIRIMPSAGPEDKPVIDSLFASVRGNRTFYPTMGAYRAMVAEGSLDLISNKDLVTSLVELYEYYYTRAVYLGTVLDGEMDRSNWERRRFFSLYDNAFRDLASIRSDELRSIEEHRHAYIGVYVDHARNTLRKLEEVRSELQAEADRLR